MTTNEIKKLMIDKGTNVTKVAKLVGYSREYVSKVINGSTICNKAMVAIIECIDKLC